MSDEYDRHPTVVRKTTESASVAEIVDVILDKGIVIDAWVRVSVLGLELLTIEARVVVASVDTYLRYAEALGLTPLAAPPPEQQVISGRENGQRAGREPPSEHEVLGYLFVHPEGLRLGEMLAHFKTSRQQLADVVNHLIEENLVRRDDEHKLYVPVRWGDEHTRYLPQGQ
jgi:gas vesicle structural protein